MDQMVSISSTISRIGGSVLLLWLGLAFGGVSLCSGGVLVGMSQNLKDLQLSYIHLAFNLPFGC